MELFKGGKKQKSAKLLNILLSWSPAPLPISYGYCSVRLGGSEENVVKPSILLPTVHFTIPVTPFER